MLVERYFTEEGKDPYEQVQWERRDAVITGHDGQPIFEQRNVEFPTAWSQLATNVVASKYFRFPLLSPERETSVRHLIGRVVSAIKFWGREDGYFERDEADTFADELTHVLLHQMASFNSPVWFNIGVKGADPQASACFILSVEDDMDSILDWYRQEGVIFKGGSGSGVNLSNLRSSGEPLSGGGTASGPLSFMRAADTSAGAIKSGGTTRRAAKMVLLDVDHPDIEAFIQCKAIEERKARALIDAGYDPSLDGDAYATVSFQNANNSVRVSDDFMRAVEHDDEWYTFDRISGEPNSRHSARELFRQISQATWECGDPGMQFDDTINAWHTCPAAGPQVATNPCSEYTWINDSACNLASLNLMSFLKGREFDRESFRRAVAVMIVAQEILVGRAAYPTAKIKKNSHDYRTLGLGYANLGALLMALGWAYDSDKGRKTAAAVTSLMTSQAYLTSAQLAEKMGPFAKYRENEHAMLEVMKKHQGACFELTHPGMDWLILNKVWDRALELGGRHGFRNAQVTLLAPTGTIAFMMDCDTTGVEPELALVKHKKLVGGGEIRIVNSTVGTALNRIGYTPEGIEDLVAHVERHGTMEDAPLIDPAHLDIFDCAFPTRPGGRSIDYSGHIKMVAAVQPFLSGAVSKTINVPREATPDDIAAAYLDAWKLGVKCVAIYRDGCKRTQPLNTRASESGDEPRRHHLPAERHSFTHKFSVAGNEGYVTVGMFEDGQPGELFVVMSKDGSTLAGLMNAFSTSISIALQYGVPIRALIEKFSHVRFEPAGFTPNPNIPMAKSIVDYLFRWLALKFLTPEEQKRIGVVNPSSEVQNNLDHAGPQDDAPTCSDCGSIMVRSGVCYRCPNCGITSGCS